MSEEIIERMQGQIEELMTFNLLLQEKVSGLQTLVLRSIMDPEATRKQILDQVLNQQSPMAPPAHVEPPMTLVYFFPERKDENSVQLRIDLMEDGRVLALGAKDEDGHYVPLSTGTVDLFNQHLSTIEHDVQVGGVFFMNVQIQGDQHGPH